MSFLIEETQEEYDDVDSTSTDVESATVRADYSDSSVDSTEAELVYSRNAVLLGVEFSS